MPIRPILLKGHSRPLTKCKFNRDGDLLVTCAKDSKPNVWYAENGERLGTFNGHEGSVYDCDISYMSTRLLTGSADQTAKLWDVQTGTLLHSWKFKSGVRSVSFAEGEKMFMAVTDQTFSSQPSIFIYNLATFDLTENDKNNGQETEPIRSMFVEGSNVKMCGALWGNLNTTITAAYDDGSVRMWDVETGTQLKHITEHKKQINSIQYSADRTMIITASSDHTAKVYDAQSLELLKTFTSDRPLNAAAISPIFNHVIVGGGQEAMNVTVTSAKVGHFEVDFYHLVYGDFLGNVKGHFGPVNTLAFNTNGKSFASGAEDGYVRLHHFDQQYFNAKNNF